MTSNIGARYFFERSALGFTQGHSESGGKLSERTSQLVLEQLRQSFSPEFLNRIDETILFYQLGEQELDRICQNLLAQLSERIGALDMRLSCTEAARRELCAKGYSPRYGARPLRRAVQKLIEDPAAEMILSGELQPQGTLLCDYNQEEHAICLTAKR